MYTQTRIKLNRRSLFFFRARTRARLTVYMLSSERSSFSGISFHLFFISGKIRPRCKLRLERRSTQDFRETKSTRSARKTARARRGMVGYSNDRITCATRKEIARRETQERVNLSFFSLFFFFFTYLSLSFFYSYRKHFVLDGVNAREYLRS